MLITPEVKSSILALADRNDGVLQPEQVVEAARAKDHPAHSLFIWDNKKAAEEHRLSTARVLIRTIRIEVTTIDLLRPRKVPAFARDPVSGYATLSHLRNDPDKAREAAILEFGRAAAALRRARQIGIELGLGMEVDNTIAQLLGTISTAERRFANRVN